MKKAVLFITLVSLMSFNQTKANEKINLKENPLNLIEFNYLNDVDFNAEIETEWIEDKKIYVHLISMKNSSDKLLAIQKKGVKELRPIAFLNMNGNKHSFKDINNRKTVLDIRINNEKVTKVYYENNDTKKGLALTAGGCLGKGSTIECYSFAIDSCNQDFTCRWMCKFAGFRCHAAIFVACYFNCDTLLTPAN